MLAKVRTGGDKIFGLIFVPLRSGGKVQPASGDMKKRDPKKRTRSSGSQRGSVCLVTCGHKHLTFWRRPSETTLKASAGRFGKRLAGSVSIVDVCLLKTWTSHLRQTFE